MADEGPWDLVATASAAIAERTGVPRHDVLVVLGSGWTPAADRFGTTTAEVAVTDLPGFPTVGVAGHAGVLRSVEAPAGAASWCSSDGCTPTRATT